MTTGTILAYLAQSAVFYGIGYVFYKLLMSNTKQPALNRAALLTIYIGALLAPLTLIGSGNATSPAAQQETAAGMAQNGISVEEADAVAPDAQIEMPVASDGYTPSTTADEALPAHSAVLPEPEPEPNPAMKPSTIRILVGLSVAGSLFALFQLIFSLGKIVMLQHFGDEHRIGRLRLFRVHSRNFSPFSFLNCMFISGSENNESEEMIIAHEMGHIRHRHWIDLLFIKLCAILMWWNPLVWLLGRELRTVHEFQADADVLSRGHGVADYQMLLVRKAASYNLSPLASHFAQSRLKRRFIMMKQRRPGRFAPMRILAVAASFVVASLILGTDSVNAAIQRLRDVSFSDISFDSLRQYNVEEIFSETDPADEGDDPSEEEILQADDATEKTDTTILIIEDSTSNKVVTYEKNVENDGTLTDGSRTVTVHDEDTGTTYTYTYNNGNLVSRSVSSSTSSGNGTSHSSSASSSSSSSSNDSDNMVYMDITGLNKLSDLSKLSELSQLSQLSELSNYSQDTRYVYDGDNMIIITGNDTTFILRNIPDNNGISKKQNKKITAAQKNEFAKKRKEFAEKKREFADKQRKFAEKQREFALKQAEKERQAYLDQAEKERQAYLKQAEKERLAYLKQAEKEREAALNEAEKAREQAAREREAALKQAEKANQQAAREREAALKQAEKANQQAAREREAALKQAEKANQQAAREREAALKQAEEARKQAAREREAALRQAEKERENAVDNETTNFEWIKQSGVTSFSNSGNKTHINVKIVSKGPVKVNGARVRYNGTWHDIKRWNVNSKETPFNTVTTIELTGPHATNFSHDDIVEIIATNTKYRYRTIAEK